MSEPIVWTGKAGSPKGLTPFSFYDNDPDFISDAPKVADWCARRLGYPTIAVELTDVHFFACFEEATNEYSHQVNQFNIREHMFELQGRDLNQNFTGKQIIASPLPFVAVLSDEYGTEVGAGGTHAWKSGSIACHDGQQEYDLQALWADVSESGHRLEIRRVFHEPLPAINRIFGAGAGLGAAGSGLSAPGVSGGDINSLMAEFGFDRMSPAINFVLLPAYEDILRIQAIEFNDLIRRSAFSFELTGNNIRIFPIPTSDFTLMFQYTVREDRLTSASIAVDGVVGDYANVPYQNILYQTINSVGRRWVFQYTLACAKDTLGAIRSKYGNIPIPNSTLQLDGGKLREEGAAEKEALIKELRETLAETGRQKQLAKQKENAANMQELWKGVPTFIYVA